MFAAESERFAQDDPRMVGCSFARNTPQISRKRIRGTDLSSPQAVAFYLVNLMKKDQGVFYKTSINKFMYFANGLHYVLEGSPMFENYSFVAHQYGPRAEEDINFLEFEQNMDENERFDFLDSYKKLICQTTYTLFRRYTATELSKLTHEPGTPWRHIRETRDFRCDDMHIPPEFDLQYFSNKDNIKRFFLDPFLVKGITGHDEQNIFSSLLEKHPDLFLRYLYQELEKVKQSLSLEKVTSFSELVESFNYVSKNLGMHLRSSELRRSLADIFTSQTQDVLEGSLAETVFDFGFIENNEMGLFFDELFRKRTAIAANLKSLPALYYLKRIFATFSDKTGDTADLYAQKVEARLLELSVHITALPLKTTSPWQVFYDLGLAHFYQNNFDEATLYIDKALAMPFLPDRYRKDLLKRAFHITNNPQYVNDGVKHGFKEFYMQQAMGAESLEEAFMSFEKGILEAGIPEAFFEAGKSILRNGYRVQAKSELWSKMNIDLQAGSNLEEKNIILGEAFLKKAIQLGVQKSLTFYVESYCQDLARALDACSLAEDKPWACYQKAKLFEREFRLSDAISAYEKAGVLLGYLDAARLRTPTEMSESLLQRRATYKERMLKDLYDDFFGES